MNTQAKVGDTIRIIRMDDKNGTDKAAARYNGRIGTVRLIDDARQLHGTWGGLAVIEGFDEYEILNS